MGVYINRSRSREHSQAALNFPPDTAVDGMTPMNPSPMALGSAAALSKFGFDCAYYRRTKEELLANGWSQAQIFGRTEIDVDSVLLGFVDPQDAQPVPAWCSRAINKILPAAPLPVRLASTWMLTKLMRVSRFSVARGKVADSVTVVNLAECGKHELEPRMADASCGQARRVAIRYPD